jgi:hypothetical protein
MKITLLLCTIAMFSGCQSNQSDSQAPSTLKKDQAASPAVKKPGSDYRILDASMDSPIIISDGSTHVHYARFQMQNDTAIPHVFVEEKNGANTATARQVACIKNIVNTDTGVPCATFNLVAPWSLEISGSDKENSKINILKLSDGKSNTRVLANFHRNLIDPEPETTFAGAHSGYIDLGVGNLPFETAVLVINSGAPTHLACSHATSALPCELDILYY